MNLKNILPYIFIFFLAFFLNACAVLYPKNKVDESVFVMMNLPEIKLSDFGFLHTRTNALNLQVYKAAQPFFELKINKKICLNGICYEKENFNQKFLKNSYYNELLEDILRAKPLWNAKNLQKSECGFTQSLIGQNYNIIYEVCDAKVYFFDSKLGTKIIWKKL